MPENYIEWFKQLNPLIYNALVGLAILIAGWIVSKLAATLTYRICVGTKVEEALARFLSTLTRYTLFCAAIISSLAAVGVQTTALIAIFASAGLAIGLALQGNLSNFASGVLILTFRPINLGEKVTIGGSTGVVKDIGLFTITLRSASNETLIVPNGAVTNSTITNYSRSGTLRSCLNFNVAPESDPQQIITLLEQSAQNSALVLAEPAPSVTFSAINHGSLAFDLYFWSTAADFFTSQQEVRLAALASFRAAGIGGPLPQYVIQNAPSPAVSKQA